MRVLYFSDNASDHNRRFLEKLSEVGMEVWFLDPTTDRLPEDWLPQSVRWIETRQKLPRDAGPTQFAEFLPEFRDWLKEIQPDLVHAGPTHSSGYVTALSKFHPWMLMSWGSDVLYQVDQGPQWRQATELALSSADGFFCDCNAVRARAQELAGIAAERIVQLPWGIRKGSFTDVGDLPDNTKFVREPGTRVLLSTRSWEPLYGIDVLLEAFRQAYRTDPSLRLILLGTGSRAPQVKEFINAHGLASVIRIPGKVSREDMPKWFRAADVYVSCTWSDGTSISLLEAMATGLPLVVTDLPANREWVTEGQNGWLAPAGAAGEFANGLLRAAALSAQDRKHFAERNQQIVGERADWDRNFPKLLKMYEQLTALPVVG